MPQPVLPAGQADGDLQGAAQRLDDPLERVDLHVVLLLQLGDRGLLDAQSSSQFYLGQALLFPECGELPRRRSRRRGWRSGCSAPRQSCPADARRTIPARRRTPPEQRGGSPARLPHGRRRRRDLRRSSRASHGPARGSARSGWCRLGGAYSPPAPPGTANGGFAGGPANLGERHPPALLARQHALERPRSGMHANGDTVPFDHVVQPIAGPDPQRRADLPGIGAAPTSALGATRIRLPLRSVSCPARMHALEATRRPPRRRGARERMQCL